MKQASTVNHNIKIDKYKTLLKDNSILYFIIFLIVITTILLNSILLTILNKLTYPYLILFLTNILCIFSIFNCYIAINIKTDNNNIVKYLNSTSDLIEGLRKQKHDFNNHINIISSYIQLNKAKKALEYAFKVCEKPNEIFNIAKIRNPLIASYLYETYLELKSLDMDMELYVNSSLENINIRFEDFYYILTNLINNSIEKSKNSSLNEKVLTIDIDETSDKYSITIINSAYILDLDENKIFNKFYNENLFGIKKLVKKYNGEILIRSDEDFGTMYIISLNK